ncbi:MAG: hypothetical protein M1840_004088 [Geoglossum simile]|nr:MAG: hypothetical protein M1840_004088 [Geoglossum simile]
MPEPTLALAAKHCFQTFVNISRAVSKDNLQNQWEILRPSLENQSTRLRLWAANIGALQRGKSSLDYRLREASDVSGLTTGILESLNKRLEEVFSIVSGERPQRALLVPDASFDGAPSECGDDYTVEVIPEHGCILSPSSEMHLLLSVIHNTITNLFRLSVMLRSPIPLDRFMKASAEDLSYYTSYDCRHVSEKFPHAQQTPWLIERLGKANTRRRQYLKYRETHRAKLAKDTVTTQGADDNGLFGQGYTKTPVTNEPNKDVQSQGTSPKVAGTLLDTVATSYTPGDIDIIAERPETARSETTFATSVGDRSGNVTIPPPPKESANGQHFECPYCFFIEAITGFSDWRKHIIRDLQPYLCTFENCVLGFFPSRHTWFNHELRAHRKEWYCGICGGSFVSLELFTGHMRDRHSGSFQEDNLSTIVEISERPLRRFRPNECPLCNDWKVATDNPKCSDDIIYVTPKQFRKHLGQHMEELALFALPMSVSDVDFVSNKVVVEGDLELEQSNVNLESEQKLISPLEQLLQSSAEGKQKAVEQLLLGGLDVEASNEEGDTALLLASANGHLDLVKFLLEKGASINALVHSGQSALHLATRNSHEAVAKLLLERGAEQDSKDSVPHASSSGVVWDEHEPVMGWLLGKGADDGVGDKEYGWTAPQRTEEGLREAAIELPPEQSVHIKMKDTNSQMTLHEAAAKGDEAVVRLLLKKDVNIDARDANYGQTALQKAAENGHGAMVRLLLELGAGVSVKDRWDGRTALHEAAENGHTEVARLLLDAGADINAIDSQYERTALHAAAYNGHATMVQLLLARGASKTAKNIKGRTAFREAANNKHKLTAQLLSPNP